MTITHPTVINSDSVPGAGTFCSSPSITSSGEPALEYTGERMVPEANRGQLIFTEHLARYKFAAQFVAGKTVLDFGSGEGYGASLLAARGATHVSGIDISPVAIEHARNKYLQQSIDFVCADCLSVPFKDNSFDLVTSFEVIEHLTDHEGYLGEACRLLKENGTLIISTPNIIHSDGSNHFHLKELTLNDFMELLQRHFINVRIFAQSNLIASMVYDIKDRNHSSFMLEKIEPLPDLSESVYLLAVCSNTETAASVQNKCMASADEERPRFNNAINDLSKSVEDHIEIIKEKDKLINSLISERGDLMSVFNRFKDMLPHINKALESLRHEELSVESSLELARMCLAVDLSESARWYLNQILQQEPVNVAALFHMGQLYYKSGKLGLAREYIKKVLQQDSNHPEAQTLIASIEGWRPVYDRQPQMHLCGQ